MKFLFRPLSKAAVYLKKRCFDLGQTLRGNGVIRRIEDGFIVQVTRRGDGVIADVIDPPAFFLCSRPLYQKALARPPYGFVDKAREQYMPLAPTAARGLLALTIDTLKLYQAPYPTVVGAPLSIGNAPPNTFPAQLRASVFLDRVCVGHEALVADAGANSGYEAAMDVTLAGFRTPVTSYADFPTDVGDTVRAAWARLFVAESGIRAILGAEHFINPVTAHLGTGVGSHAFIGFAAAGLLLPAPDEESPQPRACVLASPMYKPKSRPSPTSRAPDCDYSLFVGMVQASEPVEGADSAVGDFAWSMELFDSGENLIADISMASDGQTVTAVVVSLGRTVDVSGQTYTYNVTRLWFDASGLLGSELLHSEVYPPAGAVGSARQLWLDIGEASGVAYSVLLDMTQTSTVSGTLLGTAGIAASKAGSTISAALPGWRPFTTVSRGTQSIFGAATGINDAVRTSVVVDLGEGEIALVAAPSSQLASGTGTADWTLIVLDAESLALIESRGVIASLYWQAGTLAYATQAVSLTIISKQIKDDQGNVTAPAVLLASYTSTNETTTIRLSTDGGATWQDMVGLQTTADTYYIGNKLHQVMIGDGL
ncbi:hypothetical protein ACF8C6_09125 [Pseudomonas sp. zbq_18]|uniref:hypothetical protein n=1 Tax=Pseudomonas sp. zbq_18 TaxID=3367251 RepID=UPI00370C208A